MNLSMMSLLPKWAPNLHPLVVHFPIAILFFAVLMDFISFFLPDWWWSERATATTYLIGGACAILVFFTGEMAAGSLHIPQAVKPHVEEHMQWALWTVWFFGIYAGIRFILSFIGKIQTRTFHIIMFLISFIGLFFLFETGEHGGKLVYKYGLGTPNMPATQHVDTTAYPNSSGDEN